MAARARSMCGESVAVFVEERSTSTQENADYALSLGLDLRGRILIVTSTYHTWRAGRTFAKAFASRNVAAHLQTAGADPRDRELRKLGLMLPELDRLREIAARMLYLGRGWI